MRSWTMTSTLLLACVLVSACDKHSEHSQSGSGESTVPNQSAPTPAGEKAPVFTPNNRAAFNVAVRCAAIASFERKVVLAGGTNPDAMVGQERERFAELSTVAKNARFAAQQLGDEQGLGIKEIEMKILDGRPEEGSSDYYQRACVPAFNKP